MSDTPVPNEPTEAPAEVSAEDHATAIKSRDHWKASSRKWEERSKANLERVEQLEAATADAVSAARSEALSEVTPRLVRLAFEVEFAGRDVDLDALLAHVNIASFVDGSGELDREAISKLAATLAPKSPPGPTAPGSALFQGARGKGTAKSGITPPLNGESLPQWLNKTLNGN